MNIHEAIKKWQDQLGSIRGSVTDQMKNNLWDSARQRVSQGIVIHAFICDLAQVSDCMTLREKSDKEAFHIKISAALQQLADTQKELEDYRGEISFAVDRLKGLQRTKSLRSVQSKLQRVIEDLEEL